MKTIDEQIKFYLTDAGWYIGETPIKMQFEASLDDLDIDASIVSFQKIDSYGKTDGRSIYLKESLPWIASLVQMQFLVLHEFFHMKLGHCKDGLDESKKSCHKREYECDRLALNHLIRSGKWNKREIKDAIAFFKNIAIEDESETHPSSKSRYTRLMECIS